MGRVIVAIIAVFASITGAHATQAAERTYAYTSIDYPGAAGTQVRGINNSGAIVGSYSDTQDVGDTSSRLHGFIFDRDGFRNIDASDSVGTHPQAISESGDVAGFIGDYDQRCCASTHITGYVTRGGETTFIEHQGYNMFVQDLSDRGEVVGFSHGGSGTGPAFIWDDGEITEVARGAPSTYLAATNEPATAIGYDGRWFSYRRRAFTDLTFPAQMIEVHVRGTNNRGDMVGTYLGATGLHAFLLRGGNVTHLSVPGADGTAPLDINDNGQIAGEYYKDGATRGFVAVPR